MAGATRPRLPPLCGIQTAGRLDPDSRYRHKPLFPIGFHRLGDARRPAGKTGDAPAIVLFFVLFGSCSLLFPRADVRAADMQPSGLPTGMPYPEILRYGV